MKRLTGIIVVTGFLMLMAGEAAAQCAMCRSTLENNYANGNPGIAAGINTGILYLLCIPYLAAMILGYLWYKSSKDGKKNLPQRVATR